MNRNDGPPDWQLEACEWLLAQLNDLDQAASFDGSLKATSVTSQQISSQLYIWSSAAAAGVVTRWCL